MQEWVRFIGFVLLGRVFCVPQTTEQVKNDRSPEKRDKNGKIIYASIDYKGVNYNGLIPVIISGIQEQQGIIQKQNEKISSQQTQNAQLQNMVNDLQDKYNTMMAEIESVKIMQAQCCNLLQGGNGNGSLNDLPRLDQNTPNPFNQHTIIRYYLPSNIGKAIVNVMSIEGEIIMDFPIEGSGKGQIQISGGTLAPGTYIYNLEVSGKQIDSKRMIIVSQ